ncbi:MAG TPA: MMPL family transporter [Marmoricola sp.]|nr:MMPL family transporter [Marmoricola sp.]
MDTSESGSERPNGVIRAILRIPALTFGLWIVLGAAGMLFLPSVDHVVASQSNASLPTDAPTLKALSTMDKAFGSGDSKAYVFVVMEDNKDGLTVNDNAAYSDIVTRLKARPAYVSEVQDYLTNADAKKALVSKDGKATYIPVGLTAELGTVQSIDQVKWVRSQVQAAAKESHAEANVSVAGDPANLIDMTQLATSANTSAGVYSMALLFIVLLLIYRRVASIFVPLITIGVAALCTLSVLSLAGQAGMGLSTYTESFCVAIVLGAGTDYSIFLVSRFREEYARTADVRSAVAAAMAKIGPALLASAGTVAISSLLLNFAQLSVFSTTGPAMAVAVGTTVLVALTVTPVLLLVAGKRIGPAKPPTAASFWSRVGAYVATKPARILLVGTACLIALAAFVPRTVLSYEEHPSNPNATESSRGSAALDRHFGKYSTQPDYVLISADHDMRNSRDLAVLAAASRDIAKLQNVKKVASAAQPSGKTLPDASITSQLGKVADNLKTASKKINNGKAGLNHLKNGSASLANGAGQQAAGMREAAGSMPRLISGLDDLRSGTARSQSGASKLSGGAAKIQSGLRSLANGLDQARSGLSQSTSGIGQVLQALNADPYCSQSPICPRARSALNQIYQSQRNQLVPGLAKSANAADQLAGGQSHISDGLRNLANGLNSIVSGQGSLNNGQRSLYSGLSQLASGSQSLADGLDELPPGISKVVDNTLKLSSGLSTTGNYLNTVSQASNTADAGGFYLPNSALNSDAFSTAIKQFLSPDGRVARIQIFGTTSPGGASGIARYDGAKQEVIQAIKGTTLDGSKVMLTGAAGGSADLQTYFRSDFKLVLIAVLLTVLLLMMLVLRSLVAPLYLLASVILSYAAALGTTVIVFHEILGQLMPFNVPVLSFVLLVAVGADYNILLMSRMRESKGKLTARAVGNAVTATGPVITSAGIIFAMAFLPMVASTLSAVSQLCFTVVIGLLLDTFIVRTLIVPAVAVLLGNSSWWPGRQDYDEAEDEQLVVPKVQLLGGMPALANRAHPQPGV